MMSLGGKENMAHKLEEPMSDLENYAKDVMAEMIRQNIPPTPSNFDAYFDKLLDDKPADLRKRILHLLELEDSGEGEYQGALEQYLKDGFVNIKKFLQHIALIYKNLRHLETIVEKRKTEVGAIADKSTLYNLLEAMQKDLDTVTNIIKKESSTLKSMYETTGELVSEVQAQAIHDDRYGVYKKNYFLKKATKEKTLIKEFKHESSIMMVRAKEEILNQTDNPKVRHLILRTVARLLVKTSRRSDLVAHYEEGIFAILMRHTSLQSAERAAQRLKDLVGNTNFFVGDQEISLDVDIGAARIGLDRSIEQTIVCALGGLDIAKKSGDICGLCPQDVEI